MAARKIASLAKQRNMVQSKDTILITKLMKIAKRKKTTCSRKYPNYLVTALLQATVMRLESDKLRVEMVGKRPKAKDTKSVDNEVWSNSRHGNLMHKQSLHRVNININTDSIEMELDKFFNSLKNIDAR